MRDTAVSELVSEKGTLGQPGVSNPCTMRFNDADFEQEPSLASRFPGSIPKHGVHRTGFESDVIVYEPLTPLIPSPIRRACYSDGIDIGEHANQTLAKQEIADFLTSVAGIIGSKKVLQLSVRSIRTLRLSLRNVIPDQSRFRKPPGG